MNPSQVAAVVGFVFCSGKSAAEILRDATNRAVADYRAKHQAKEPLSIEMLVTSDQRRGSNREGMEA
jgi:hypothetical protein